MRVLFVLCGRQAREQGFEDLLIEIILYDNSLLLTWRETAVGYEQIFS